MAQPQPMVVAVAGGTGGVGKTIVQQLQLHRERFKVIVLTRSVSGMMLDILGTVWSSSGCLYPSLESLANTSGGGSVFSRSSLPVDAILATWAQQVELLREALALGYSLPLVISTGAKQGSRAFQSSFNSAIYSVYSRYGSTDDIRQEQSPRINEHGTEHIQADYSTAKIDGLRDLLVSHRVNTVISTITINEKTSEAQMNLIRAAIKANESEDGVLQWFIPSEFGYVNVKDRVDITSQPTSRTQRDHEEAKGAELTLTHLPQLSRILSLDASVQHWISAASLLASSPLQYTRVANGFFVDYLGMPYVETNMDPFTWVLDIYGRRAAIPGDGTQQISLTHTVDVGRYLVKLLDVAQNGGEWDEWSIVVGEDISFIDILKIAERVRGGIKFQVTHDTIEMLESGRATVLPLPGEKEVDPSHMNGQAESTCALFSRLYLAGVLCMPKENRLSDRWREEIPLLGVEEFLVDAWKGRS
ncbi:hypothetical protein LTR84_009246 [Exophiala bonariae]|uniref:NmrA-like domain-containing protein n=1 Tax=Exophiala bonariae TaxID=1690606 RepID=A0AAV9MXC8_9EURO|nr:hypothetical protein LTR84_009246 [Exophiala bonariae]